VYDGLDISLSRIGKQRKYNRRCQHLSPCISAYMYFPWYFTISIDSELLVFFQKLREPWIIRSPPAPPIRMPELLWRFLCPDNWAGQLRYLTVSYSDTRLHIFYVVQWRWEWIKFTIILQRTDSPTCRRCNVLDSSGLTRIWVKYPVRNLTTVNFRIVIFV